MIEMTGQDGNQQVSVDMTHAKGIKCEKCDNDTFKQTILLKRLSSIVSPTGQEVLIPVSAFACEKCGHVNDEFRNMETS